MKLFFVMLLYVTITRGQLTIDGVYENIYSSTQTPTYSEPPTSENVLVVFNNNNDSIGNMSRTIKDYYINKRSIPSINTVALLIPPWKVYNGRTVYLTNFWESIVRDDTCAGSIYSICDTLTWHFFMEFIANPIRDSLASKVNQNGDTLKNKIKYIVLCKGVPLKIQSGHPWIFNANNNAIAHTTRINVSVEALLCLLDNDIMSLYNNPPTPVTYPIGSGIFGNNSDPIRGNPYFNADPNISFNYRFQKNHFISLSNWKLSYLVSRLDGNDLQSVKDMIDRNCFSDKSGSGYWVFDNDSLPVGGQSAISNINYAYQAIDNQGFNKLYNDNLSWIVSSPDQVIGYVSHGSNSSIYSNLRMPPTYILDTLEFEYKNGALFNSWESFNGFSYYSSKRNGQGLLSDHIYKGGSVGAGHTWEPYVYGAQKQKDCFLSYSLGYNAVDAIYQSMPYLGWQSTIVGDPLTTIAWGKQTLTANTEWEATNLVTGKITVPQSKTLTIKEDAVINFRHLGSLEIDGYLIIEKGAKLNFHNGGQLVVNNGIKISGASNKYVEIDFISPNSTTENGIILNESAIEDTLIYVKIKNAYRGITVNEKTFYINYAEITNCEAGMYLYRSDYQLTMNEGTKVLNSEISSNQTGIYLNQSSPQFISNIISGNNNGVEMINESAPVFGEYLEPGINTFSDNDYNIVAMSAFPTLGANYSSNIGEDYVGGFNEFIGASSQFVSVDGNGYVMAEINWWDGSPPDPNMFEEIKGTIDYDPWLDNPSSPLNGSGKGINSIFVSGNSNTFDKILIDIAKNDIASAWRSLKIKLNDSLSIFGIHLLKIIERSSELSDSAKSVMQQISSGSNNAEEIRDYAKLSLIKKRGNSNFVTQLNQTANSIRNKNVKGLALFKLFSHYYFSLCDKENANNVLNRMKIASLTEKWITEAERLLGNYQSGNNQNLANNNHGTGNEIIIGNYPNPFNPLTNISFSLPERSIVELTIYNILGQKIVTLKNEVMETGSYSVQFDATQLPSGVYVYRLTSGGFTSSKKMLLIK